jgi:hypothetical protein
MNLKEKLDFFHKEGQFEHQLIAHRMTWYVTSQSFLMAAFAASGSNQNYLQDLFGLFIPLLGIVISVIIWISLRAADSSMKKLKDAEKKIITEFIQELEKKDQATESTELKEWKDLQKVWYADHDPIHFQGMLPPRVIPGLFTGAWAFLLTHNFLRYLV